MKHCRNKEGGKRTFVEPKTQIILKQYTQTTSEQWISLGKCLIRGRIYPRIRSLNVKQVFKCSKRLFIIIEVVCTLTSMTSLCRFLCVGTKMKLPSNVKTYQAEYVAHKGKINLKNSAGKKPTLTGEQHIFSTAKRMPTEFIY